MGCTRVMLSSLKIRIILLKRLLKLSYPYFRTTKYLHNIISCQGFQRIKHERHVYVCLSTYTLITSLAYINLKLREKCKFYQKVHIRWYKV